MNAGGSFDCFGWLFPDHLREIEDLGLRSSFSSKHSRGCCGGFEARRMSLLEEIIVTPGCAKAKFVIY